MRIFCVVNAVSDVRPSQTTALIVQTAVRRGHEVVLAGVGALGLGDDGTVRILGRRLDPASAQDTETLLAAARSAPQVEHVVCETDTLLLRFNPARDEARAWAYRNALVLATLARDRGALVINDPEGLARAGTKLFAASLPAHTRPATLVSRDPAAFRRFAVSIGGPLVLKPLAGTRGRDVFLLDGADAPNFAAIVDVLTRDGFAVAQAYLPDAVNGDTRVVVLDGAPLRVGDVAAAIRRVPPPDDFRSNVAVGGRPEPGLLTPALEKLVADVAPALAQARLHLVGLDVIGGLVVEVNAFATGGLYDGNRFFGVDFTEPILAWLENRRLHGG